MRTITKKLFIFTSVIALAAAIGWASGVHFGLPGAVKSKVKELSHKIQQNKMIVSGTAASGHPIASALVTLKDCAAKTQTGTTAPDGSFSLDATALSFPLLLRVASGTTYYYSIADSAGTSNVSPLTDVVLRSYFRSARGVTNVDSEYAANSALVCAPTASVIALTKSLVTDIVSPVLIRNGIDPLAYDLFTTAFSADSSGFDKALDETQVIADTAFSTVTICDIYNSNNVVLSTITTAISDFTLPAAPTDLSTTTVTSSTVTLHWTLSVSTNAAGYAIYRDGTRAGAVQASASSYIDKNLRPGTQYSYAAEAFTWAGKRSAPTPSKLVTTSANLSILRVGTGTGTVVGLWGINCGTTCSADYTAGTPVILIATAGAGSIFVGWSGEGCTGISTCTITVSGAKLVTATFNTGVVGSNTLTVTKAGTGSGTVTSSPAGINCGSTCSSAYAANTGVTLSAIAAAGSVFAGWSGDGCSGTGTCAVTMSTAKSVTATFNTGVAPQLYTLYVNNSGTGFGSVTSNPAGIDCAATTSEGRPEDGQVLLTGTCSKVLGLNTQVTLTGTATAPSVFTGWSGGGCSGTAPCRVTMDAALKEVTATFTYPISLTIDSKSCPITGETATYTDFNFVAGGTMTAPPGTEFHAYYIEGTPFSSINCPSWTAGPDVQNECTRGASDSATSAWSGVLTWGEVKKGSTAQQNFFVNFFVPERQCYMATCLESTLGISTEVPEASSTITCP